MKIDFKGILEAVKNKHFSSKELRAKVKEVSEERLAICKGCPFYSENNLAAKSAARFDIYCLACGCNLDYKTSCLSCACPLPQPKWEALVNDVENTEIQGKIIEDGKGA